MYFEQDSYLYALQPPRARIARSALRVNYSSARHCFCTDRYKGTSAKLPKMVARGRERRAAEVWSHSLPRNHLVAAPRTVAPLPCIVCHANTLSV